MYCMAISAARTTIDIANPYFVPDHVSIDLFRDATKRGVRVRVMVAGTSNDNIVARLNSVRLYGAVLEAGVELYEYNRTMMHHKIMIVDGLWSTVGTSNFDNRSFSHNEENNVSAVAEGLAQALLESFERDLLVCDRITLDDWKRRSIGHKSARSARLVRSGSGLSRRFACLQNISPKKSQNHSLILPSNDRCFGQVCASSRVETLMSASKSRVSCAASSRS